MAAYSHFSIVFSLGKETPISGSFFRSGRYCRIVFRICASEMPPSRSDAPAFWAISSYQTKWSAHFTLHEIFAILKCSLGPIPRSSAPAQINICYYQGK